MSRRIRLVGLPGTGKTTRLLKEIDDLIKNEGILPSDIIFCSHSNASVNEARKRIENNYGHNGIQFTTMHKLAKQLVTDYHGLSYLTILDNTDDNLSMELEENPIIEFLRTLERKYNSKSRYQTIEKYKEKCKQQLSTYFRIKHHNLNEHIIDEIVDLLEKLYIPNQLENLTYNHASDPRVGGVFNDLRNDLFIGLYNLIQIIETAWAVEIIPENSQQLIKVTKEFLKYRSKVTPEQLSQILLYLKSILTLFRNGAYSFNQVLFEALNHKLIPDGSVLIIDEYQDIGKLQYDLSELWAMNMQIFVVAGDPNQSIYGFNGVSPDFLENFNFDIEINLLESYRVPTEVIEYASEIYSNQWTTQMVSKNEDNSDISMFNVEETVNYLTESSYKSIYVLCRSDEIKKYIQLRFLEYGLYNPRKEYSFDLLKSLQIKDEYLKIENKINTGNFLVKDLSSFLKKIERIEGKYDIKISSNYNRTLISKLLQNSKDTQISSETITQLNLTDDPKFTPMTNTTVSKTINGNLDHLKELKKFQAKRIVSMIYKLTVNVENNQAGLQELNKFVKQLQNYEKRLNIPITRQLSTEDIDQWKYNVQYRNFRNTLEFRHLEKFKITELRDMIEIYTGGNNKSNTTHAPGKTIHLTKLFFHHHSELIKHLNDTDRNIFDFSFGLKNSLKILTNLRKRITFLTMHGSKGREAECVIIPNMKTFYEEKNLTDPEESRRVYFVAVTRTKKDLIIMEDNQFPKKPSQFLPKIDT